MCFNSNYTADMIFENIAQNTEFPTAKLTILLSCFDQMYLRFLRTFSCSTLRAFSGCNQHHSTKNSNVWFIQQQ